MKYILLIILAFTILMASCKKSFLEVPQSGILTLQGDVKDLKSVGEYLNGIYINLSYLFYDGFHQVYPDLIADNIKTSTVSSSYLSAQYNWSQQADQQSESGFNMNKLWTAGYGIARSCSFVIERCKTLEREDEQLANKLSGQAYALRALVYFNIVNIYAQQYNFTTDASHSGIPYVKTYDISIPVVGRNSVKTVYDNLIIDLETAIEKLPAQANSTLYFNRDAARALLSRVLLFKGDFAQAKNRALEVIDHKPFMEGNNYPSKLFTLMETEALFQLPPSWKGVNNGTYFFYPQGAYFAPPLLRFLATRDIVNILTTDPMDKRSAWVTQNNATQWFISKFPTGQEPGFPAATLSYYPTILRSSEMYLTAAESYAQLNNSDSALYYLNAIKLRANPTALPTVATGAALLDSIFLERRKELAFEGLRMFDLLRWKKGVNRQDAWNAGAQNLPYPSNKAIAPIPALDVTVTGLQQNPGY